MYTLVHKHIRTTIIHLLHKVSMLASKYIYIPIPINEYTIYIHMYMHIHIYIIMCVCVRTFIHMQIKT